MCAARILIRPTSLTHEGLPDCDIPGHRAAMVLGQVELDSLRTKGSGSVKEYHLPGIVQPELSVRHSKSDFLPLCHSVQHSCLLLPRVGEHSRLSPAAPLVCPGSSCTLCKVDQIAS
jgi:hypothetical protein